MAGDHEYGKDAARDARALLAAYLAGDAEEMESILRSRISTGESCNPDYLLGMQSLAELVYALLDMLAERPENEGGLAA